MTKIHVKLLAAAVQLFFFISMSSANSHKAEETLTKVFYHQQHGTGWNAVVRGRLVSIGVREEKKDDGLTMYSQDKTKAGVRLFDTEGLNPGDILFVINEKNLIVAKLEVKTLFKSVSFGTMCVGYGNFRLAKPGNRVVQKLEDRYSRYAYIYKSRGDYYRNTGDKGESINHYKKAIEIDRNNPEAHLELGKIYFAEKMYLFAYQQFEVAYRNIGRMYDREDRYQLLRHLVLTRYQQAYNMSLPSKLRYRYINEGIDYAKKALEMKDDSPDIHFTIGMFYFRKPDPMDVEAKEHMLKVIESEPQNVEAYIVVAELYYKHRNFKKSLNYADMALKIEQFNERARFIKKAAESRLE